MLIVKNAAALAAWAAQAEGQGLPMRQARPKKRKAKRTPAQLRSDLVRAIGLAPSELGRRFLTRALERFDREYGEVIMGMLVDEVVVKPAIVPASYGAGTTNGTAVDTNVPAGAGATRVMAVLNVGAVGGGGTLDVKLQESADGSTGWVDVSGAAFAQVVGAGASSVYLLELNTLGRQRYLRAVGVVAVAAVAYSVNLLLYNPALRPVAQDKTIVRAS